MSKKHLLIALAIVALVVVLSLGLTPPGSQITLRGVTTRNLSNAKQLATGAALYASDHDGAYPAFLNELAPDYVDPGALGGLLYSAMDGGAEFKPQYDWLYFAAGHDDKHLPRIIIASPQAVTIGRASKRVVVYDDLSAAAILEEQYQRELHQMIDAAKTPKIISIPKVD